MDEYGYGIEIECFYPKKLGTFDDICSILRNRGVRIENIGYTHETKTFWKIVVDRSIKVDEEVFTTCEFVSPVLHDENMADVQALLIILKELGFNVNESCGLHIHQSIKKLKDDGNNLKEFYKNNESLIDTMFPANRRRNRYACSLRFMKGLRGKHFKVNFNSRGYGTIEFRQHEGTLDFIAIKNWYLLTNHMLALEKWNIFNDLSSMFDFLGCPELLRFYKNREVAFRV